MYKRHGPYGAGLKVKDKILLFQGVSSENGQILYRLQLPSSLKLRRDKSDFAL
jgi:hypothetical protein